MSKFIVDVNKCERLKNNVCFSMLRTDIKKMHDIADKNGLKIGNVFRQMIQHCLDDLANKGGD